MRFVSLVVVLLFAACVAGCEQRSAEADVAATPVSHTRALPAWNTDPSDAVGRATALIRSEGYSTDEYPIAGASFDSARGEWRITFPHQPLRDDFDEVVVLVDDLDQSVRIAPQ